MARVGIPRALAYYTYFPVWKAFLEGIGASVVLSRPTTRQILDPVWKMPSPMPVSIKIIHEYRGSDR